MRSKLALGLAKINSVLSHCPLGLGGGVSDKFIHHRDTKITEVAQRGKASASCEWWK